MWWSIFQKKPKAQKRLCCFHFGRCGSKLIANMVGSHPDVDWKGELFHDLHESQDQVENPWASFDESISHSRHPIVGFEAKFQHLDSNGLNLPLPEFIYRLKKRNFSHFIVLKRKNYLRQAISVARGQASQRWHFANSQPEPEFTAVLLDPQLVSLGGENRTILECFRFLDSTYEEIVQALESTTYLFLNYEEDFQDDATVGYNKITQFLEIRPQQNPQCITHRINKESTRHSLSNFETIEKLLCGTPYEWMLN